ncbi:uncharacterized protein LOC133781829 [Humulus lupulus]|uniref:uncharacterized protein LOC133781829 n=1 Tax=Humulus lupulus TaxID=3486 RepID=UPI002B410735|nr:uncharacterized protein LOC133781829 [Humulus lupulus]
MALEDEVAEGSPSPILKSQESDEKSEALSLEDIAWVNSCLIKESEIPDGNWNSVTDALLENLSSQPGLYNSASVSDAIHKSQESDEKSKALLLEDIAWVNSRLIKESEIPDGNWNSVSDALLEILSSKPGLYNSASVSDECSQDKDVEMVTCTESAEDGQLSGTRTESGEESPRHANNLLSIIEEAGSSSDISPIRDPNDSQSVTFVGNPFLPSYIEGSSATETAELETDPSYSVDEIEPLADDIFKVWDLSIPAEENELDKQLNKILEESDPQLKPSILNDSDIQKDLKEVSLDDVIAAIAEISINENFS